MHVETSEDKSKADLVSLSSFYASLAAAAKLIDSRTGYSSQRSEAIES